MCLMDTFIPFSVLSLCSAVFISLEEAVEYLKTELGIRDARARKIIDRINAGKDDKLSEDELAVLTKKVKEM